MTNSSPLLNPVPKHVAIIMDGNGRWAKNQGKVRISGHKAGINGVKEAISFAAEKGIERLTLFAFSSENWKRPEDEVKGLMELFAIVLTNDVKTLHKNNVKMRVIGDISRLSRSLQKLIKEAIDLTANNTGIILNLAVNYGGRWDVVQAVQHLIEKYGNEISVDKITEASISENLSECKDVDLLIRTGGEKRISNFLLWQLAYSEIYVSEVLWPDFDKAEFQKAIDCFMRRERRFGLTGEQVRQIK
jgi:undecaprenyl diphosphate synthase